MYRKFSVIDPVKCQKCEICPAAGECPKKAIEREDIADPPYVNQLKCKGCINCIKACPYGAISQA